MSSTAALDALVDTLKQAERQRYGRVFSAEADARIRTRLLGSAGRSLLKLAPLAVAILALFASMGVFGSSSSATLPSASAGMLVDGGIRALDGAFSAVSLVDGEPGAGPVASGGPRELP